MGFFQTLLTETIKSLLANNNDVNRSSNISLNENIQPGNDSDELFSHDHTIYCKWCEIADIPTRKKAIAGYLLTINSSSFKRLQANLEHMKINVITNMQHHEANEKFAWGSYIEDQIAYQNAKLRTGVRDPKFMKLLNEYKLSLETINWTIEVCSSIWKDKRSSS